MAKRRNGISVLIASQNEEALIGLCIRSFLDFGDELIVVDNGSTDRSKKIIQALQARHPEKIKFYDAPDLPDLHHNRQYALSKSSYRWIVRADADFVAYTDGEYDIAHFRKQLLQDTSPWPAVYGAPLPNVSGDFWHTGQEHPPEGLGQHDPGRYIPPPITQPTLRIYKVFSGFRFKRLGRWEGTTFNRFLRMIRIELKRPLWMHCNLKSDLNHLYRSERTNWRELGDFVTYPTLDSYLRNTLQEKYGTDDVERAAELYMQNNVYPFLYPYDPNKHYPYPRLVQEQMQKNSIYKLKSINGTIQREYLGIDMP